jgi:hypothetical protein
MPAAHRAAAEYMDTLLDGAAPDDAREALVQKGG